jgi:Asp-tRNA(Asn)/Glu-tRNA(Gln) amidotransferase A subunit family amidase
VKLKVAVMIGKTNMDESPGLRETSYWPGEKPRVRRSRGSSGGSARRWPRAWSAATGTDTGSIRQPAALCGITGLPTYGRVALRMVRLPRASTRRAVCATAEDGRDASAAGFDPRSTSGPAGR